MRAYYQTKRTGRIFLSVCGGCLKLNKISLSTEDYSLGSKKWETLHEHKNVWQDL